MNSGLVITQMVQKTLQGLILAVYVTDDI